MRYACETTIDLPRDTVIALFDDPANLARWQPELESFTHVSGEPGRPGAKSRLVYRMGRRVVEMTETVTVRDLPDEFSGTYEAPGVFNTVRNRFEEVDGRTRWTAESEFRFAGMMRYFAWLMPGLFRRQTEKFMRQFKEFAESSARG